MVNAKDFLKVHNVPESSELCRLLESYSLYCLLSICDAIVEPEGSSFICHGVDFKSLHDSDNYAFGDTEQEAVINYMKLYLNKEI